MPNAPDSQRPKRGARAGPIWPTPSQIRYYGRSDPTPVRAANAPVLDPDSLLRMLADVAADFFDQRATNSTRRFAFESAAGDVLLPPRPIWDYLGGAVEVQIPPTTTYFRFPRAELVIEALEEGRGFEFEHLRMILEDPEQFYAIMSMGAATDESSRRFSGKFPHVLIALFNAMIIYVRHKYSLPADPEIGWHRGRVMESDLMLSTAPPPDKWGPELKQLLESVHVPLLDAPAGFVLPGGSGGGGGGLCGPAGPGPGKKPNYPSRFELSRLLFSMGLSAYRELRAVVGKNPNDYIAIVFSDDPELHQPRVGLETAWTNNRFFGLCGPLEECLELAQARKGDIRAHPLCKEPIEHDQFEAWKRKLRAWLGC